MIEKYIILSLLYLEWFIQKLLCFPYHAYIKIDNWNFNRNLDQKNKELAEKNTFTKMSLQDYIKEPKKDWNKKEWLQHAYVQMHNPWISEEDREYWRDKVKELQNG